MIIHGDCLEVMPTLGKVDMILADLPYGTTACKWDTIIPFEPLWENYKRLVKDNGAVVLFGSEPFSSYLRMSNIKDYKYDWVWEKNVASNFMQYKFMPAKKHEMISVFCKGKTVYNPIMENKSPLSLERMKYGFGDRKQSEHYKTNISLDYSDRQEQMYPTSIKKFNRETGLHPTQKPVALFEYLIKTYTNEGETVLDNTAGSMTTAIACINTNRNYICIEKDKGYYEMGKQRVDEHLGLFKEAI